MAKKPKLGERRCPRCKEVIRADAEICKHCHTTFTPEEVATAKLAARNEWIGTGGGCLTLLALLLVGSCVWTALSDTPSKDAETKATETAQNKVKPSLPFTPDQFAKRFNRLASSLDRSWSIDPSEMDDGILSASLTDKIAISAAMGGDGRLANMVLIGAGDGTARSGLDVYMAMSMVICAAADEPDIKVCGPVPMTLVKQHSETEQTATTTINGVQFSYTKSEELGNFLGVDPAE